MQNIKNLAQLKRALTKGATFTFTDHWRKQCIGQRREVNIVQTNAVFTVVPGEPDNFYSVCNQGKGMYFPFGKAKDWKFNDGVCTYKTGHGKADIFYSLVVD